MKNFYLSNEEIADFFAELYILRQSEIPEQEALQMMAESQDKKAMQYFMNTLVAAPSLIQGLEQLPNIIPEYITALLVQAAKNNSETQALSDIAAHLNALSLSDNGISYKQQLIDYLIYPVIVLLVASIVATITLVFVVPVFDDLFKGMGAELPALTRLFIEFSDFVQRYLILSLILMFILIVYLNSSYSIKIKSKLCLSLPIIKRITASIESTAVINTLYLLSSYQFGLAEALRLSATATYNTVIIAALTDSANNISNGKSWLASLKQIQIFSVKTLRLLLVFEKTQQLFVLKNLVQSYSKLMRRQIALSLRLLSIILSIFCWLLVGGMVIALYLPIFKTGAAIG